MTLIADEQSTEVEYPVDRALDLPSPPVAPEFLRFVAHAVILSPRPVRGPRRRRNTALGSLQIEGLSGLGPIGTLAEELVD